MMVKNKWTTQWQWLFTGIILLTPALSQSQEWMPFRIDEQVLYKVSTPFEREQPSLIFEQDEVVGIELDRSDTIGAKAYHWNYSMIGCSIENANFCRNPGLGNCTEAFSWVGEPLIYDNGWWSVNKWSDTIQLPMWQSSEDTLLKMLDTVYVAEFLDAQDTSIYGSPDSIKAGLIKVFVNGVPDQTNTWHHQEIILSKNVGLMQTPMWCYFPNYLIVTNQVSLGDHGLLGQIFGDYKVGDHLDYEEFHETGELREYNVYKYFEHGYATKSCRVISADYDETAHRKHYELLCHVTRKNGVFPDGHTRYVIGYEKVLSTDTISLTSTTVGEFLKIFKPRAQEFGSFVSLSGDTIIENNRSYASTYSTPLCPIYQELYIGYSLFRAHQRRTGLTNYDLNWVTDYSGDFTYTDKRLVYFRSANYEYGIPLGMENVTGTSEQVTAYPNPAFDVLQLQGVEPNTVFVLHDLQGTAILSGRLTDSEISLNGLEAGLYFLNLKTKQPQSLKILKL